MAELNLDALCDLLDDDDDHVVEEQSQVPSDVFKDLLS
jgi:hypothetical protein